MPSVRALNRRPRNTLFRLTRVKPFGLHRDIEAAFAAMSDSDLDRLLALTNLSNIRRVVKRPNLALGEQGDA